jgi:hypothetical protein
MMHKTNIAEIRKKYRLLNAVAFSIDVDWAGESLIADVLEFFSENSIPLTVFCTHYSEVLLEKRNDPKVELGIHPNYTTGSSQGNTIDEVTDFCLKIVPDARCMRAHRWFRSNDVYDTLIKRKILFDSNECSMMDVVEPYIHRSGIMCMPAFFEDGWLLWSRLKLDFNENGKTFFSQDGLKVIDIHPVHFSLNSPTYTFYKEVCQSLSREEYNSMTPDTVQELRFSGKGMRDYILELVEFIAASQIHITTLGQVYDELRIEN